MYNQYSKIHKIGVKCPNKKCSFAFTVEIGDSELDDIKCPICKQGDIYLSTIYQNIKHYNYVVEQFNRHIESNFITIIE